MLPGARSGNKFAKSSIMVTFYITYTRALTYQIFLLFQLHHQERHGGAAADGNLGSWADGQGERVRRVVCVRAGGWGGWGGGEHGQRGGGSGQLYAYSTKPIKITRQ